MEEGPSTAHHRSGSASAPEEGPGAWRLNQINPYLRLKPDGYSGHDLYPAGAQESLPPVDGPDGSRRRHAAPLAIVPGTGDEQE
jgi:hypothetical protein